ncbi:MAG TPA: G/U mismatch-specific DNA glycosylase [Candidatus Dormibacteraeota bacterium]
MTISSPTRADLEAARGLLLDDVLAPGLRVVFCGINPGLYTAWAGHHFARPGNRFWKALHLSGFTPRLFRPSEQRELLGLGLGLTNLVARTTARADELSDGELKAGAEALKGKLERYRPRWLAVLGAGAYRVAFAQPRARLGPQRDGRTWVLPNPSGLNAHYQLPALVEEFRRLRTEVESEAGAAPRRTPPLP